jgi:hypothetical protein
MNVGPREITHLLAFSLDQRPIRRQAIALPNPRIAATNLLSKSQISYAMRTSGLCGGQDEMAVEPTSERSGKLNITGASTFTCSTNRAKSGSHKAPEL